MVGTVSRSNLFQQPIYSELVNVILLSNIKDGQVLYNKTPVSNWADSYAISECNIGHNGALHFAADPVNAAARVLSLSAVKSKDIYDHNYSIMIGAVGDFISVVEQGVYMYKLPVVPKDTDVFTIERHNSDTIKYCLNGEVFYTSTAKSTADLYFVALFEQKDSFATHILMNYDICADLTIKFNKNATEAAVESVAKAVSYQGTARTLSVSVTNNTGLKSAKTLAIKAQNTRSIPVLSGTIPRVHDSTLFEKCSDLSISHEGVCSGLEVLFNTHYPQFTSFVVREINNVSFKADTRKISYNGVIIGTGNTVADMAKQGLIITFNDNAIKESVEEVTKAIGVNFQVDAQDVTLSLVNYNGDKSVKTLTISTPFG